MTLSLSTVSPSVFSLILRYFVRRALILSINKFSFSLFRAHAARKHFSIDSAEPEEKKTICIREEMLESHLSEMNKICVTELLLPPLVSLIRSLAVRHFICSSLSSCLVLIRVRDFAQACKVLFDRLALHL